MLEHIVTVSTIGDKIDKKNLENIFFSRRFKVATGGEKMNSYLYEVAKNFSTATTINLDSITEKFPKRLSRIINFRYLGRLIKLICFAIYLPKKINSILYLSAQLLNELCLYLLIERVIFSSKIIVYVHLVEEVTSENINDNIIRRFIYNKFIHIANFILTNSVYSKNKLLSFGIPAQKIKVIYPLLLTWPSNYKPGLKNEQNKITLLFIGTDFSRKGLQSLLKALVILDRRNIFLNIVGDVNKEFNLGFIKAHSILIKKLETKNMIKFLSEVNDAHRKEELFTEADIFVMPSLSEGFGIVFAEAMAYHLPIIAANTTAIPELVRAGYNGILVPPEDSKALAGAIEALADNKELRIKMGNSGYKMIKDFYESYSIENEFCSVLEGLQI